MSVRTDRVNLNVNVNGNQAKKELNDLRKKSAEISAEMETLGKRTKEYAAKKAELKAIGQEMQNLKKQIGLTALSQKELVQEITAMKAMRGSMTPFSKEFKELSRDIAAAEKRLYDVRNGVQGFNSVLHRVSASVKQFGVLAAGYLGFQFITEQFSNIIRNAGKTSDSLADIQRTSGMTADEVDRLNKKFKELDTRTSTEGLREIAIIAGKLGVAKQDIYEFTAAVDQLVVALGDELGDADAITTTLGKILNVFEGEVTGENITRLGNAFVELANAGVASAGFIADFDQRLSGIAKTANIGLGELSGLGAGLEELGGRVESSSTAVQKVIMSMAADLPKAAKVAGMGVKEFNELFAKDGTEALLRYSEGLVKNKASFAEVTASLAAAGEEGARTVETIAKLGQNADMLRQKVKMGAEALHETSAITEAFTLKNQTLGATIDKLGKEFNRLISSPALTNFLKAAINGTVNFIKWLKELPQWIDRNKVSLTLLAIALLTLTKNLILNSAQWVINKLAIGAQAVATGLATTAIGLYRIALALASLAQAAFTRNTLQAGDALATLKRLVLTNPLGLLITALLTIGPLMDRLLSSTRKLSAEQRVKNELEKRSADAIADEVAAMKEKLAVARNENLSLEMRKKALDEVKAASSGYLNALNLENLATAESINLIDRYIGKLREESRAKALKDLAVEKEKALFLAEDKLANTKVDAPTGWIGFNPFKGTKAITRMGDLKGQRENIAGIKKDLEAIYKMQGDNEKNVLFDPGDISKGGKTTANVITENASGSSTNGQDNYKKLLEEGKQFAEEVKKLQREIELNGMDANQAEIERVKDKYAELMTRAKKYADSTVQLENLTRAQRDELRQLMNSQQKKAAEAEYEDSQKRSNRYFEEQRQIAANNHAQGITTEAEYNKQLTYLELQEKQNRVTIAKDYAGSVKKAEEDVHTYTIVLEKATTEEKIKEAAKRKKIAEQEAYSAIKLKLTNARPGSTGERDAKKEMAAYNLKQRKADWENQFGEQLSETSSVYLAMKAEFDKEIADIDTAFWNTQVEKWQGYAEQLASVFGNVASFVNNIEERRLQKDRTRDEKRKQSLKNQLNDKLLSQAQHDKKVEAIELAAEKREKEARRRAAQREKAVNIFSAMINTAGAIAKALNNPWPLNIALAAAAGIAGGIQIAAIASEPLPEMGKGGWLKKGDKHSDKSRGIPIMAERDESIMAAGAMTNPRRYNVSGTTAQITSRLNELGGGISWSGGAKVVEMPRWRTEPKTYVNPTLHKTIAAGSGNYNSDATTSTAAQQAQMEETNLLLRDIKLQLQDNTAAVDKWKDKLKAVVSIKELRDEEKKYDDVKKASGFN